MITGQPTNGQGLNGSQTRVLIVDDERDGATSLGMLLKMRGYTVEVVTDSTECPARLDSFNPDVLLLDIAMPRMSGYDLAKQIRAQWRFDRVAIIAISGYADQQHTALSLESGCDQHLVKPADLATIETILAQTIEKRTEEIRQRQPQ
jgi:DNA-binding response OmpR family regulator